MKVIPIEEIQEAHELLLNLSEVDSRKLLRKYQKKQEPLLVYTSAVMVREELNDEEQDLFISMTLLMWHILLQHFPKMKRVSMEEIETADDNTYAGLPELETMDPGDQNLFVEIILNSSAQKQMLGYMLETVNESPPETGIREEVKGMLFFTLKNILDLLLQAIPQQDEIP